MRSPCRLVEANEENTKCALCSIALDLKMDVYDENIRIAAFLHFSREMHIHFATFLYIYNIIYLNFQNVKSFKIDRCLQMLQMLQMLPDRANKIV